MGFLAIKRKTKYETRYGQKMGRLTTKVTYIQKQLFGVSIQTVHKYRETYYGEIKDCRDCDLSI